MTVQSRYKLIVKCASDYSKVACKLFCIFVKLAQQIASEIVTKMYISGI